MFLNRSIFMWCNTVRYLTVVSSEIINLSVMIMWHIMNKLCIFTPPHFFFFEWFLCICACMHPWVWVGVHACVLCAWIHVCVYCKECVLVLLFLTVFMDTVLQTTIIGGNYAILWRRVWLKVWKNQRMLLFIHPCWLHWQTNGTDDLDH